MIALEIVSDSGDTVLDFLALVAEHGDDIAGRRRHGAGLALQAHVLQIADAERAAADWAVREAGVVGLHDGL